MTDIVIVGGGVIGASIAFQLAARGATGIVLLERDTIGSGETHKSGGFVQTMWPNLAEVRLIAHSREVFANWCERVGGDCGWVAGGYLQVTGAARESVVREVMDQVSALGLPCEWLDQAKVRAIQPSLYVDDLVGGVFERTSGWASSLGATRACADAARARGVEIREHCAVTKLTHANNAITGVETSDGAIAARVVILAVGPWTNALHVGPPLHVKILRGQATLMSRPGGEPRGTPGFYDEETGLYMHPDGDMNLVGIDWPFEPVVDADAYSRELDPAYLAALRAKLAYRFPALATAELVTPVVGLYDFTPDGQPIVDEGGLAGYYVATGFSGIGFKSSPATGLGMAELVLDGRATSVDIGHLKRDRFGDVPLPASHPALPGLPPALAAKLEEARALLTDTDRGQLAPFLAGLGPDRLPAIASAMFTLPASDLAAFLRAELAK